LIILRRITQDRYTECEYMLFDNNNKVPNQR